MKNCNCNAVATQESFGVMESHGDLSYMSKTGGMMGRLLYFPTDLPLGIGCLQEQDMSLSETERLRTGRISA